MLFIETEKLYRIYSPNHTPQLLLLGYGVQRVFISHRPKEPLQRRYTLKRYRFKNKGLLFGY